MKPKFYDRADGFVIENYNFAPPFSDFFPGLAGITGKPLWVFYANRGQCISSFGINNKDGAILEFLPANKAYQATPFLGFRTFIKLKEGTRELFSLSQAKVTRQLMVIRPHELELSERDGGSGLEVSVVYFGVPGEEFPVLARRVTVQNISSKTRSFQILDGLPRLMPKGMNDYLVKNMSRTIEAFSEVIRVKENIGFYKLKIEPHDRPEIRLFNDGYFSFTMTGQALVPLVIDPTVVFGADTSFQMPLNFYEKNLLPLSGQLSSTIMPCSFGLGSAHLAPQESKAWTSFFGHAGNPAEAARFHSKVLENPDYFQAKREEMRQTYVDLVDHFGFVAKDPALRQYAQATFLDNVLRGGFPMMVGSPRPLIHVYSRKHGDMERDYNAFQISATYFSQGNGNFRDVSQNRRNDLFLNPGIEEANVETFFNFLQIDGYNPLVINPERFVLPRDLVGRVELKMTESCQAEAHQLLKEPVLAGHLYEFLKKHSEDPLNVNNDFREIISAATPQMEVQHGEGFWTDHWIYSLDHLDHYLTVFPDKKAWLLFEKNNFTFYDSEHAVKPRKDKYVITKEGLLRQYEAVGVNEQKKGLIASRTADKNKLRCGHGHGDVLKVSLFVKLLTLVLVKISSLDPGGVGIEMEADKPGWCDALNGCPGLFGSSSHEMFELLRLVKFLLHEALPLAPFKAIDVPQELHILQKEAHAALEAKFEDDFRSTWDTLATAREAFRESVSLGMSDKKKNIKFDEIKNFLETAHAVLDRAVRKAVDPQTGLPTSYFTYEVDAADLDDGWRQHLAKLPWKQHRLPAFLEGAVHAMKLSSPAKAKDLYQRVRQSELFDKKLGMYRLNTPLENESTELGRVRIFAPGWLENESIFLHMHYKYLLEILRAGMMDSFVKELPTGLIPFRDSETYGRPSFENSSFIASSAFSDVSTHGRGFVARLSGATSEFMTMIYHMMFGSKPFQEVDGKILFSPTASLPGAWFLKAAEGDYPKDSLSLRIFGVLLTYINPSHRDTFGPKGVKPAEFEWILDGRFYQHGARHLPTEPSLAFREGRLESLKIIFR